MYQMSSIFHSKGYSNLSHNLKLTIDLCKDQFSFLCAAATDYLTRYNLEGIYQQE